MLCSEFQLVKQHDSGDDILPLTCNCWHCDYCGPRRRRKLMALAASGKPNKMLTLTVNPSVGISAADRYRLLHEAWKKLVKRILRHYRWKKLHYMAFVEKTKRGEPHLHVLLRCEFLPQKWLSAQMRDLVGAPFVWISKVRDQLGAVTYVSKYVTKEPGRFGNSRRYWASRQWSLDPVEPDSLPVFDRLTMRLERASYRNTMQQRIGQGWTVEELDDGWQRWWRPGHRTWRDVLRKQGAASRTSGGASAAPPYPPPPD